MDHPIEGFIDSWFTYDYAQNTVDVFNTCFPVPELQPPNTIRGYSFPNNGDGMIGLAYAEEINYREVASVLLTAPLMKDSAYCVSFWVKNSKIENMYYWVDPVGVLFTNHVITQNDIQNFPPHVASVGRLDINDWVEVSGYYIAAGGEMYLNIGFFGPGISKYQNIPYDPNGSNVPFYFFDDVSVTPCNKDSLLSVVLDLPNAFTPNGDHINDFYQIKHHNIASMQVQVVNRWGNPVAEYDGLATMWDGTDRAGNPLTEGVYFVQVTAETTFGEALGKQQVVHLYREEQ